MSYGMEYSPVAAQAASAERVAFIRRTYMHLAGGILVFAALETFLLSLPQAPDIVNLMLAGAGGRFSWLLVLGAFMAVNWLANSWARSSNSLGVQYLGWSLCIAAWSVLFLPLLYIANSNYFTDQHIIRTAGILTLAISAGLTVAVFVTGRDFSFLRTYLVVGGVIAMGFIVASIFIGFNLGLVFCFAMVALSCGYVVYDTSNVMLHYRTDQHVAASLALFTSVALMFWYIVQILMMSGNRR